MTIAKGAFCVFLCGSLLTPVLAGNPAPDVRFVEVENGVKLEVVDWGGEGRPLVFLHGAGCDAHVFDRFAPKFTSKHRVYGITRRGAGVSSAPVSGYSNARYGKDVLAVIESLKLVSPVLVGHSMAGWEMSWISTHNHEKISGFIYLDAAYSLSYYSDWSNDPGKGILNVLAMRKKLERLVPGSGELHPKKVAAEVIAELPRLQQELTIWLESVKDMEEPTEEQIREAPPYLRESYLGLEKYTALNGPILAIFAEEEGAGVTKRVEVGSLTNDSEKEPARGTLSQAEALERGVPSARVVRIPGASHFVFQSHEAEVIKEMNLFIDALQ